ncbi:hypothetical protein BGZ65_011958, partial [Modicella reniformis]
YLNLGSNRLGFEGIVQLSGLYKNDSLVELDLSDNHLGPKAVHSLQQVYNICTARDRVEYYAHGHVLYNLYASPVIHSAAND